MEEGRDRESMGLGIGEERVEIGAELGPLLVVCEVGDGVEIDGCGCGWGWGCREEASEEREGAR